MSCFVPTRQYLDLFMALCLEINAPFLREKDYPIIKAYCKLLFLRFNDIRISFRNFHHEEFNLHSISNNHITALYEDKNGNILIGTENGLNVYNGQEKNFIRIHSLKNQSNFLSNNYIRSLFQDSHGVYWIGTNEGGLNRMVGDLYNGEFEFTHFRSGPNNVNFIGHDIVYSLYEDRSQNLWIGTIDGLDRTDLKTIKFRIYKKTEDPSSLDLLDNIIGSVYIDEHQRPLPGMP